MTEEKLKPETIMQAKKRQINWDILQTACENLVSDLNKVKNISEMLDVLDNLNAYEVAPFSDVLVGTTQPLQWCSILDHNTGIKSLYLSGIIEHVSEMYQWRSKSHRAVKQTRSVRLAEIWYDRASNTWEYRLIDGRRNKKKKVRRI